MSILVFPFQEKQLKIFTAAIFDIVLLKIPRTRFSIKYFTR